MASAIAADTALVYIANPNNPTGTHLPAETIAGFLARVPPQVVVVIDEAYNEYLPPERRFDSVQWVRELSESADLAHVFEGVWVGRAASRLWHSAAGTDRSAESRAAAV